MKVLGIDPGSHVTGYGVIEKSPGGGLIHVCHGEIRPGKLELPQRLLAINDSLTKVIEEVRPETLAIESVFFAKNVKSAILLGHARSVPLLLAAAYGLDVFEYDPRSVKAAVTGFGGATKDQVQRMVQMLLKTQKPPDSDAADALAVAICHIHHRGRGLLTRMGKRKPIARGF